MQEGEKQKLSRAEDEIEFVKKIEEKTGEITPGNALNLLTLSKQEIDRLLTVEKLSKNQRKKILKRQIWLEKQPERAKARREKRKNGQIKSSKIRGPKITTLENFNENFHLGIDYATEAEMTDHELLDLGDFLQQSRRVFATKRFDEAFESTSGKLGKLLDAHAGGENGSNGWKNWDVHKDPTKKVEDYMSNCVYLTAEAEETLETIEPGTMYIIGGVVDRNRLPGVCAERAKKLGIVQKRLPITENINFSKRTVLTIVHVFEILLAFRNGKKFHGKPSTPRESSILITNTKESDAFVKIRTTAPKSYLVKPNGITLMPGASCKFYITLLPGTYHMDGHKFSAQLTWEDANSEPTETTLKFSTRIYDPIQALSHSDQPLPIPSAHVDRPEAFGQPAWLYQALITVMIAIFFAYCFTMNKDRTPAIVP
ncbi:Oidioi.mRNA.OKI2018_I69.chr1.g2030.t2.cds [Oikopleura dioica]|uniref:tRNA (guanine(9)-N(1))-methyltransferase n=1 Tax=Oikopleura dioica TaxID=34765 RepID=A0ABN7SW30_OIKDI|nr:Oidioi.mRNA.OKI2018_I69.chr1.g2030.t2.cds [Oikopleura dioica]